MFFGKLFILLIQAEIPFLLLPFYPSWNTNIGPLTVPLTTSDCNCRRLDECRMLKTHSNPEVARISAALVEKWKGVVTKRVSTLDTPDYGLCILNLRPYRNDSICQNFVPRNSLFLFNFPKFNDLALQWAYVVQPRWNESTICFRAMGVFVSRGLRQSKRKFNLSLKRCSGSGS
jgi:hypothetical protein